MSARGWPANRCGFRDAPCEGVGYACGGTEQASHHDTHSDLRRMLVNKSSGSVRMRFAGNNLRDAAVAASNRDVHVS